jgi:hypothetical protein
MEMIGFVRLTVLSLRYRREGRWLKTAFLRVFQRRDCDGPAVVVSVIFSECSMRIPEHPPSIRRMIASRLKKVALDSPVLAASFSSYTHRCNRPGCRCRCGGALHTSQQLTCKEDGKTRSVYVPLDLIPEVRTWIAQYRRHKELLKEIHQLTMALVQTHVRHARRTTSRA